MTPVLAEIDIAGFAATRAGEHPRAVLLHAGVADRRSWYPLMTAMHPDHHTVAYDRPGFGDTPPATTAHADVDQLDIIAAALDTPVTLIGNSQGGRIAIDYALAHPDRVDRLILIAPAISGAPAPRLTGPAACLAALLGAADAAGDTAEVNRLEALIWLDGPAGPEGRVHGPVRDLFLDMNGIALSSGGAVPADEPAPAHDRLDRIDAPVRVIVGDRDLPHVIENARRVAERTGGRIDEVRGVAHLPQLERPAQIARLVSAALRGD